MAGAKGLVDGGPKMVKEGVKKEEAEEEAVVEENVVLLTEIRDLLREKK